MYQDQITQFIRREISATFAEMGASALDCIVETLLIRDGCYCGRRFYCEGFQAVWFVEEQQVKFFDEEGRLVKKRESCLPEAREEAVPRVAQG